jgi:hypothetical protein
MNFNTNSILIVRMFQWQTSCITSKPITMNFQILNMSGPTCQTPSLLQSLVCAAASVAPLPPVAIVPQSLSPRAHSSIVAVPCTPSPWPHFLLHWAHASIFSCSASPLTPSSKMVPHRLRLTPQDHLPRSLEPREHSVFGFFSYRPWRRHRLTILWWEPPSFPHWSIWPRHTVPSLFRCCKTNFEPLLATQAPLAAVHHCCR